MQQFLMSIFSDPHYAEELKRIFSFSDSTLEKLLTSLGIFLVLTLLKILADRYARRKVDDLKKSYESHRLILYVYSFLLIMFIGRVWIEALGHLTTFLGLVTAGLAIAMHDIFANLAGWAFIVWRKPFRLGDRIQIGANAGDIVDIRLLQFSMVEIGNWVDADQSTGRIIHIPNVRVLREALANYHIGFEFIWNEVAVPLTFDSEWREAKKILTEIVEEIAGPLAKGAEEQIRQSAEKFLIYYSKLTPIVYTTVRDKGIVLTARYLVDPRKRRSTEHQIWESILDKFGQHDRITLAYPATRVYFNQETPTISHGPR
jgi:small-conductance mechanosensitive channel